MKKQLIAATLVSLSSMAAHASDYMNSYEITITNATAHQVLTPPVVVAHNRNFNLFSVGSPASDSLAILAKGGNPAPLLADAQASAGVFDAAAGDGVIPYGHSATISIMAPKNAKISLASMLATTNDAFAGLMSVSLPRHSRKVFALAYDAGAEMNNESCAYIPGPPCAPESGNADTDTMEGFISIHNGIHGGADLNAKHLDWRGPVAIVTIKKMD